MTMMTEEDNNDDNDEAERMVRFYREIVDVAVVASSSHRSSSAVSIGAGGSFGADDDGAFLSPPMIATSPSGLLDATTAVATTVVNAGEGSVDGGERPSLTTRPRSDDAELGEAGPGGYRLLKRTVWLGRGSSELEAGVGGGGGRAPPCSPNNSMVSDVFASGGAADRSSSMESSSAVALTASTSLGMTMTAATSWSRGQDLEANLNLWRGLREELLLPPPPPNPLPDPTGGRGGRRSRSVLPTKLSRGHRPPHAGGGNVGVDVNDDLTSQFLLGLGLGRKVGLALQTRTVVGSTLRSQIAPALVGIGTTASAHTGTLLLPLRRDGSAKSKDGKTAAANPPPPPPPPSSTATTPRRQISVGVGNGAASLTAMMMLFHLAYWRMTPDKVDRPAVADVALRYACVHWLTLLTPRSFKRRWAGNIRGGRGGAREGEGAEGSSLWTMTATAGGGGNGGSGGASAALKQELAAGASMAAEGRD